MTAISVLNQHAAGFGDRLANLVDLLNKLRGLDLTKLTNLVDLVSKITEATTLRERISSTLSVLELAATMTSTTLDDTVVAALKTLQGTELFDMFVDLVTRYIDDESPGVSTLSVSQQSQVEAAGLSPSALLAIAQLVAELLKSLRR